MVSITKPKTYDLRGVIVVAQDMEDGLLVDPELPEDFDNTDNKSRPYEHAVWWGVPFIRTHRPEKSDAETKAKFPNGVVYELRCLDGGAWDRSTWWGEYATVELAATAAKNRPGYILHPIAVL